MLKAIKLIIESLFWLNIFIVPVFISVLCGYGLYYFLTSKLGLICFIVVVLFGVISGIRWAERVRKTVGCSTFVNRIFSSDDIDKPDQ